LTVAQIRTSGTIALCKHNRVMITSPQDLVYGYPWADTVVHELVHWFVIKRGGARVPLWLHEGLARGLQVVWRGGNLLDLDRDERATLALARKAGRFIPLAKMRPSLAVLPSQDDTQLAFAEVHHAAAWLLQRQAQRQGQPTELLRGVGQVVALFAQGLDEPAVLQQVSGLAPSAFAAAWKRDLQRLELRDAADAPTRKVPITFRSVNADVAQAGNVESRRFAELGDRLALLGRPQAAAVEYRKALAAGPQQGPYVVARLVRVLLDLSRLAEALDFLQPALAEFPEHAPLCVLAGRAAVQQARWREALDYLERAAWLNPFDPAIHALSAQAWTALGQEGEAAAARARQALVDGAGL
ncbi:MAG: tetratricopeptide repeat protein, partial [Deltaproteobacteria bacterium]|nr:tetratricopeptide repeat protein [Deltaproteobacteria bacterium]